MTTKFKRLSTVIADSGLPRSTIYKRIAEGSFPTPIKLGPRTSAWLDDDYEEWARKQIGASRGTDSDAEETKQ